MSTPVRPATRRRLLFACLLLIVAVSASAIVIGGPGLCRYYSDNTYTTVVGTRSTGCCGGVTTTGTVTPYVRCERFYCPDVICPNAQ
jgi:hypothetical protein